MNFKTYCLSLKKCTDRREWMLSIKNKIGLDFEFFDAYTPEDITEEIEAKWFSNTDLYSWDINQKAAMATFMSHMKLLEISYTTKTNLLIIEDDLDINRSFDWDSVKFDFDLYNIGFWFSCYAYFVSWEGAGRILDYFNNNQITQAYDWELKKLYSKLNFKRIDTELFSQTKNMFESNIAPKGYIGVKKSVI